MPAPIFVRLADQSEGVTYFEWATASTINEFDQDVALFPSSRTWCAYDKSGPVAFQTIQRPLMLESLAPRPGLDKLRTAQVLKELTQNAITQAHLEGAGEIWFMGSDAPTDEFAENYIFERVWMPVYRVKLRDLAG